MMAAGQVVLATYDTAKATDDLIPVECAYSPNPPPLSTPLTQRPLPLFEQTDTITICVLPSSSLTKPTISVSVYATHPSTNTYTLSAHRDPHAPIPANGTAIGPFRTSILFVSGPDTSAHDVGFLTSTDEAIPGLYEDPDASVDRFTFEGGLLRYDFDGREGPAPAFDFYVESTPENYERAFWPIWAFTAEEKLGAGWPGQGQEVGFALKWSVAE
jgi:hypothetical protein